MTPTRLAATLLAIAIAIVAAACGGSGGDATSASSASSASAAPTDITLSYDWPTVDFPAVPIAVAQEKGWFDEQGLKVNLIFPPDPASSAKVLATGKSNLALLTTTDVVFAAKSGLPVRSIGNYTVENNWGLFAMPGTPLSIDDLKGKSISTFGDSWTNAMLPFVLKAAGLTDKDVKEVVVDEDLPLLLNGKVDIITDLTSYIVPGVQEETGKDPEYLLAKDYGAPNAPVWVWAGNADWLQGNAEAAKGFMAAMGKATEWACANADEATTIFEKAYPDNGASHAYNLGGWTDNCKYMKNADGTYFTQTDAQWTGLAEALQGAGQLEKVEAPSVYYTNEYLPQG